MEHELVFLQGIFVIVIVIRARLVSNDCSLSLLQPTTIIIELIQVYLKAIPNSELAVLPVILS